MRETFCREKLFFADLRPAISTLVIIVIFIDFPTTENVFQNYRIQPKPPAKMSCALHFQVAT